MSEIQHGRLIPDLHFFLIPALKKGHVEIPLGTVRSEGVGKKSAPVRIKEQEHFLGGIPKLKRI